jgi:hypothetical protein
MRVGIRTSGAPFFGLTELFRPGLFWFPMTNADEDALRAARPAVAMWIDRLRHAGHVVFLHKIQRGHKLNARFRIDVDGRVMTVWELWARFRSEIFRSEIRDGKPQHVAKLDPTSRTDDQPR